MSAPNWTNPETLVLHAGLVVQLVMAGLLLTSLASWTVIFGKVFSLRSLRRGNDDFEREITFLRIDRCEAIKHHAATVVVGYAHADIDRVVLIVHVTGARRLLVG